MIILLDKWVQGLCCGGVGRLECAFSTQKQLVGPIPAPLAVRMWTRLSLNVPVLCHDFLPDELVHPEDTLH